MPGMGRAIERPRAHELWLIGLTGLLHVVIELGWGSGDAIHTSLPSRPERVYNASAVLLWGLYVLWQALRTPGLARRWGLRADNFATAARPCLFITVIGAAALLGYGVASGRVPVPRTFWVAFWLYPVYGVAQQFALQALMTRNLQGLISRRAVRVALAAACFSAAHFPDGRLMALTALAGLAFTWVYERHPNIWAIGIAHGILGALAYYLVLGLDPGTEVLQAVRWVVRLGA